MNKPRGLGRGLDALLPSSPRPAVAPTQQALESRPAFLCALERIHPNRGQPRRHFEETALEELASSIREHGLIEPIVVRRTKQDDFEIVAGERRWRACQRAGLREALIVVKDLSDKQAYEVALIENVQREDLNPLEFASALKALIDEHGHTQETLAKVVSKDRTTITNALRLLKLPAAVRELVVQGSLSEGHARALLGAPSEGAMIRLAHEVVRRKLSVRQTEAEVRALKREKPAERAKSPSVRDLEQRLSRKLGTRCQLNDKSGKGEIVVRYANLDELDRILDLLL